MGIRDRLKKARKRISDSEGTKRLRGDIENIKRMSREHTVKKEAKAEKRMARQQVETKRIRAETRHIRAKNELAKAKNSRGQGSSRMRGPFDAPGAGGIFGQGSPWGGSSRGGDLPGLIGASSYGDPPGMRRKGPSRRRKKR